MERPPPDFPSPGSDEVVLYDVERLVATSLGTGAFPRFSPDGSHLAWITPRAGTESQWREVQVLDIASMAQRSLGAARHVRWLDRETLIVSLPGGNEQETIDLGTGGRQPVADDNPPPVSSGSVVRRFALEVVHRDDYPLWRSIFRMTDSTGALEPLKFEAYRAELSEDGQLFVVTTPEHPTHPGVGGSEFGESNLFAVDPITAEATHIAAVSSNAPNWPFSVNAEFIVWTDNACDFPGRSRTLVLDRRDGSLSAVTPGLWVSLTSNGLIAAGQFSPKSLIDPETLEYVVVLPTDIADVRWSPDYRYAANGFEGGHGGLC